MIYRDSSNNNFTNNQIITSGAYSHGIYLYSLVNSNIIRGNNITTLGSNSYGIYL
jgi:hypothetical protein